jgi:hypothetical protein
MKIVNGGETKAPLATVSAGMGVEPRAKSSTGSSTRKKKISKPTRRAESTREAESTRRKTRDVKGNAEASSRANSKNNRKEAGT